MPLVVRCLHQLSSRRSCLACSNIETPPLLLCFRHGKSTPGSGISAIVTSQRTYGQSIAATGDWFPRMCPESRKPNEKIRHRAEFSGGVLVISCGDEWTGLDRSCFKLGEGCGLRMG